VAVLVVANLFYALGRSCVVYLRPERQKLYGWILFSAGYVFFSMLPFLMQFVTAFVEFLRYGWEIERTSASNTKNPKPASIPLDTAVMIIGAIFTYGGLRSIVYCFKPLGERPRWGKRSEGPEVSIASIGITGAAWSIFGVCMLLWPLHEDWLDYHVIAPSMAFGVATFLITALYDTLRKKS
jgi:hypothetical protein